MIDDLILQFEDEDDLVMETDRPFDLLDDTVTQSDVLEGVKFHLPNGQAAYGTCSFDADTSDGTALPGDIAEGKIAYSHGIQVVGTYTLAGATPATATASDIRNGATAWVNGAKKTGTWVPKATMEKMSSVYVNKLWIPAKQYAQYSNIQIPVICDNVYSLGMTSASQVSIKRADGTTVSNVFTYTGCGTSNNVGVINISPQNGPVYARPNQYYVEIQLAQGTFIRATVS